MRKRAWSACLQKTKKLAFISEETASSNLSGHSNYSGFLNRLYRSRAKRSPTRRIHKESDKLDTRTISAGVQYDALFPKQVPISFFLPFFPRPLPPLPVHKIPPSLRRNLPAPHGRQRNESKLGAIPGNTRKFLLF